MARSKKQLLQNPLLHLLNDVELTQIKKAKPSQPLTSLLGKEAADALWKKMKRSDPTLVVYRNSAARVVKAAAAALLYHRGLVASASDFATSDSKQAPSTLRTCFKLAAKLAMFIEDGKNPALERQDSDDVSMTGGGKTSSKKSDSCGNSSTRIASTTTDATSKNILFG